MALEEERRRYYMEARTDRRKPRKRITLCVEEIERIARSEADAVRQHIAVRDAVISCVRDLERYSHEPSGFRTKLRAALTDRSLKLADENPKLGLWLERAVDFV
jgi:hypothetical protein